MRLSFIPFQIITFKTALIDNETKRIWTILKISAIVSTTAKPFSRKVCFRVFFLFLPPVIVLSVAVLLNYVIQNPQRLLRISK